MKFKIFLGVRMEWVDHTGADLEGGGSPLPKTPLKSNEKDKKKREKIWRGIEEMSGDEEEEEPSSPRF